MEILWLNLSTAQQVKSIHKTEIIALFTIFGAQRSPHPLSLPHHPPNMRKKSPKTATNNQTNDSSLGSIFPVCNRDKASGEMKIWFM